VVIAPHAAFAAGSCRAGGNVVPATGAVVDGVEEQTLVSGRDAQVGLGQERAEDREAGLAVAGARFFLASPGKVAAQAEEPLGGDGRGRTVDRLMIVERIRGPIEIIVRNSRDTIHNY